MAAQFADMVQRLATIQTAEIAALRFTGTNGSYFGFAASGGIRFSAGNDFLGLIAGAPDSRLSGGPIQPDSAAVDLRRDRAHSGRSRQGRAVIQFSFEKQEADLAFTDAGLLGVRLQGLEKGLVKESGNFDGELLQKRITIESLRVRGELAQGYGIARPMPPEQLHAWAVTWRPNADWRELT